LKLGISEVAINHPAFSFTLQGSMASDSARSRSDSSLALSPAIDPKNDVPLQRQIK